MGEKRARDGEDTSSVPAPEPKKRKGFRVGPDNLPDGPWRRKVTKVKKELIHKAKVKKAYAKVKAREEEFRKNASRIEDGVEDKEVEDRNDMHPDRLAMLDGDDRGRQSPDFTSRPQGRTHDGERRIPHSPRSRSPGGSSSVDNTLALQDKEGVRHRDPRRENHRPQSGDAEPGSDNTNGKLPRNSSQKDHDGYRPSRDGGTGGDSNKEGDVFGPKSNYNGRKTRRPGYFDKELTEGGRKRQAADARRKETERRGDERGSKMAERQRIKKKAKKAHMYLANGQKKLGRESSILLEKVQRMMGSR